MQAFPELQGPLLLFIFFLKEAEAVRERVGGGRVREQD